VPPAQRFDCYRLVEIGSPGALCLFAVNKNFPKYLDWGSLRTMPETLYTWRIFRIKTGPAKLVATVKAPDAKTAVMVAAVKLRLRNR
jgi:hypothetical protein